MVHYWSNLLATEKDHYKRLQIERHIHQLETSLEEKETLCGLYNDMGIEHYHSAFGYSASKLKKALKSTRDFFKLEQKQGRKEHFDYGNIFEMMLLEEEKFNHYVEASKLVVYDENDRPEPTKTFGLKENKEWKKNIFDNAEIVVDVDTFKEIKENVRLTKENEQFGKLVDGMLPQQSYFWIDDQTNLLLKTRPDIVKSVGNDAVVITDVKTAVDGSPDGFAKSMAQLHYPLQAVTQIDGVKAVTGKKVVLYTYLVIEKSTGNVQFYSLNEDDIQFYRDIYKKALIRISKALHDPSRLNLSYSEAYGDNQSIIPLEVPKWQKNKLESNFNNQ